MCVQVCYVAALIARHLKNYTFFRLRKAIENNISTALRESVKYFISP